VFCRHCGNALPDDAAFCPRCGKSVDATPAAAAPPTPVTASRPPENPTAVIRGSYIVGAVGLFAGLVISMQIRHQAPLASVIVVPLVLGYGAWAWWWGIYRLVRDREKFFFRPMRAVTFGLWRKAGTNDPIGCIRIVALPFIVFLALVVFDVLVALLIYGSFLYGVFGGAFLEHRRLLHKREKPDSVRR
jgi:zinc-ribbon domain